jgi:hypothetical protein
VPADEPQVYPGARLVNLQLDLGSEGGEERLIPWPDPVPPRHRSFTGRQKDGVIRVVVDNLLQVSPVISGDDTAGHGADFPNLRGIWPT